MTSRERLLCVLRGDIPDCVPVCPDISNMVPARLTGKPFWDIYVYKNPPLWKAYIDAIKRFDIDGGFELYQFGDLFDDLDQKWIDKIVHRNKDGSFVTQEFCEETGEWKKHIRVHTADNPPAYDVLPEKIGLPAKPSTWEAIDGVKKWPTGLELWKLMKKEMGNQGIIGMPSGVSTLLLSGPEDIYEYYDNPGKFHEKRERMIDLMKKRMKKTEQYRRWANDA